MPRLKPAGRGLLLGGLLLALAAGGGLAWRPPAALEAGWKELRGALGWPAAAGTPLDQAQAAAPQLTLAELRLLTADELDSTPFAATPRPGAFARAISPHLRAPRLAAADGPYHRYLAAPGREVVVDPALPAPRLALHATDSLWPEIELDAGDAMAGRVDVRYYAEFDTSPGFDSPQFWRYPALIPRADLADLTGRAGLAYALFSTTARGVDGRASRIRFPFRVIAMALPLAAGRIGFAEFAKFARLVAHGVPAEQVIREFYEIGRYRFFWASDEQPRQPLDTFAAGLGECAYVNDLIGAMLEVNGYRYRMVAGFNPIMRQIRPAGGHSAIEVLDPAAGRWSYVDPYLDILAPGVAAEQFAGHPVGNSWIYDVDTSKHDPAVFGTHLTLAGLFRYRRYGDVAGRLPMASMLQLATAGEARYGLDWPLRPAEIAFDPAKDLPETATIHVRGRYVLSDCAIAFRGGCADPAARASTWQQASFTIRPRALLAAARAAQS